ncbi:hypothetical protein NMG60_11008641 [Bertholletia excelsa]
MDEDGTNDNTRTIWTLPMDNYFIELLLDQVHRGNKTGKVFSKEAWTKMISLFNDQFGFRHETDVLKNRYKWLRKQYNNIRLLIQSGFSWDEKRHMVTADNNVWDDYIKEHPEMQTYRTKVVPHFSELCIICGHAVADGRYSLSCFDIDYENEAKLSDDQTRPRDDRPKLDWSQKMDEYFIKLMLENVSKGNKVGHTFKSKAWVNMISQFNTKFGYQCGKVVLKIRYNVLRRQYSAINFLLGQRGFSWDAKRHMLMANDRAWKKVIKVHRKYQKYKNKPIPFYIDMCSICRNEDTVNNISPHSLIPENDTAKIGGGISVIDGFKATTSNLGSNKNLRDQQTKCQPEMQQAVQLCNKVPKMEECMTDAIQEMAVAVTTLTKRKNDVNSVSVKDVIRALQAIPDIDEDLLLDACDFLEDERKARMFLALDESLRKKWLMRKLRP